MQQNQRIVIVGGGAGGLELAAKLGKKLGKTHKAEILLIDSSPIHLWKPLLHEYAAGTLFSYEDEISYLAYSATHYFQFCLGTMQDLDRDKKEIILSPVYDEQNTKLIIPERRIAYDILVIAIGSISNDFNIPGVKTRCLMIDNSKQALHFHDHLIKMMMALPYQVTNNNHHFNIVIVGGGATGVELAAELNYALTQLAKYGYAFDPNNITISLVEAANRLLPALSNRLSTSVADELRELGIKLYIGEQVSEITADGLKTKSGKFIPASLIAWSAGIKAPEILRHLGLEVNKINQLIVKPTLQTTNDDTIFALGDCASCQQTDGKLVPPRAQAAHQQATLLAKNIINYLNDKPLLAFQYQDHGSLISLSHYETVGNLMGRITKSLHIQGRLARLAYLSLYRSHQISLFGYWRVASLILSGWLTSRVRPRLKLH